MIAKSWPEASDQVRAIAANLPIYWGSGDTIYKPHVLAIKKDFWSGEGMGYNAWVYPGSQGEGDRHLGKFHSIEIK